MTKSILIKSVILVFAVLLLSDISSAQQDNRFWWNSLSPAWKKVIRDQELKGKEIDPTDEQLLNIVNLISLNCRGNKEIQDLKPLARLSFLQTLDCSGTNVSSLEGLESLTNLKTLDCSDNDNINSLIPLSSLPNLETLNCGNTMVKNLSPLRGLYNLKHLDVHFCTVNSLSGISELKNILDVDVSENQSLFTIDGIEKLPGLVSFNCSNTRISNVNSLQYSKTLEILDISNTDVVTLRPLQMVRSLKEIDCSNTKINAASFDYFYSHTRLSMFRARNVDATQKEIDDFATLYAKHNANCDVIITPK